MRKPLLLIGLTLLLAGCGTGGGASGTADQTNGQKQFQAKCAGCHVLSAAGSQGTVGPNLDDAFRADKQQGFKESTIRDIVLVQIRQPSAPMPANLVKGQDAQDVAAFVASAAGSAAAAPPNVGNDGKAIFQANCASCHTLQAASASGTIGPNLDQLKPAQSVVQHQVEVGGGVMPAFKGKLTDEQIAAVATFVADNAGK